jgi:hypothetical protein
MTNAFWAHPCIIITFPFRSSAEEGATNRTVSRSAGEDDIMNRRLVTASPVRNDLQRRALPSVNIGECSDMGAFSKEKSIKNRTHIRKRRSQAAAFTQHATAMIKRF